MAVVAAKRKLRAAALFLGALCLTVPLTPQAAEQFKCASVEESDAFRLRHLQSRLMVAALGCDQQAAYNTFVEHFRPVLVSASGQITDYFQRVGGGQAALNKHITELANAAGLSRAEDPNGFCKQAWELFWTLEQEPLALVKVAEANILATAQPQSCSTTGVVQADALPQNKTATFDTAKAAVNVSNK